MRERFSSFPLFAQGGSDRCIEWSPQKVVHFCQAVIPCVVSEGLTKRIFAKRCAPVWVSQQAVEHFGAFAHVCVARDVAPNPEEITDLLAILGHVAGTTHGDFEIAA